MFDAIKSIDSWPSYRITWMVLAVAFLALLPAWLNYDIISRDGAFQYIPTASLFLEGRFLDGLARPQLPLFPLLLAGFSKVLGLDLETSGRLISALGFILACLGIYKVSEFIFKNRLVALLSVLFLISNRELIDRSVDCLKESLLLSFVLWGNYLILKGTNVERVEKAIYLISGVLLLLLGTMVRTTALFFLGAWIIMWAFRKKEGLPLRVIILASPVGAIILLILLEPESAIFNRKGFAVIALLSAWPGLIGMFKSGLNIISNFFATGNYLIVFFGCLALYFSRINAYYIHLCLALAIFFVVLSIMGWTSDRYLLAPIVWLYPIASYACVRSVKSINKPIKVLAVIAIISCPIMWADKAFSPPDPDKVARKEAGKWIFSQIRPGSKVITNRDRLAFYAHGKTIPLTNTIDIHDAHSCIAIDIMKKDGKATKKNLDTIGIKPDKVFGPIYIYLPGID